MRLVRDRTEARWLPSRFNLALFRAYALVRFHLAPRTLSREPRVYSLERNQSAVEANAVCAWYVATTAVYLFVSLRGLTHPVLLAVLALPTAAIVIHLLAIFSSIIGWLVVPRRMLEHGTGSEVASLLLHSIHIAVSIVMLGQGAPARWIAFTALTLVAANLVAAVMMFLLRPSVERLEDSYVGGALFGE